MTEQLAITTPADVEPFDTHREIRWIRSTGNKDVRRCVACGNSLTEIGVIPVPRGIAHRGGTRPRGGRWLTRTG